MIFVFFENNTHCFFINNIFYICSMNDLHDKIKQIRVIKGLKQADMAEKIGIAPVNYNRLENGLTDISMSRLNQLAEIFGMTVIEIMQYGDEKIESKETILTHILGFNLEFLIRDVRAAKSQIELLSRWISNDRGVYDKLNEKYLAYQQIMYEKDLEMYSRNMCEEDFEKLDIRDKKSSMYKGNYERTLEQYFNMLIIVLTVRLSKQLLNKNMKIDIEKLLNTNDFNDL